MSCHCPLTVRDREHHFSNTHREWTYRSCIVSVTEKILVNGEISKATDSGHTIPEENFQRTYPSSKG
jgi:hypothetical protein